MADSLIQSVIRFKISGAMAHFRKFYTNSSSLSYPFPPRTTVAGIIAAILGIERDVYYDLLSMEKARIGLALKSSYRSIMQTINFPTTKKGEKGRTQIPTELILPSNGEKKLVYEIVFSHCNNELMDEFYKKLDNPVFPLYLGLTECPAVIEEKKYYKNSGFEVECGKKEIEVQGIIPISRVIDFEFLAVGNSEDLRFYKDRIPLDFSDDRKLKEVGDVIWEHKGKSFAAKVKGLKIKFLDENAYFVLMEP